MMIERLHTLALILERMEVLYQRAIDVLSKEKQYLIVLDFDSLYTALREKDEILAAIKGLDRDRLRIQDQFATVMDFDPKNVDLKLIAEELLLQDQISRQVGSRLLGLREKLQKTIEVLKEKIEFNKGFIEKSVENMRGIAEHFSAAVTGRKPSGPKAHKQVYTDKAKYQESSGQTGSLIEKRL